MEIEEQLTYLAEIAKLKLSPELVCSLTAVIAAFASLTKAYPKTLPLAREHLSKVFKEFELLNQLKGWGS